MKRHQGQKKRAKICAKPVVRDARALAHRTDASYHKHSVSIHLFLNHISIYILPVKTIIKC